MCIRDRLIASLNKRRHYLRFKLLVAKHCQVINMLANQLYIIFFAAVLRKSDHRLYQRIVPVEQQCLLIRKHIARVHPAHTEHSGHFLHPARVF